MLFRRHIHAVLIATAAILVAAAPAQATFPGANGKIAFQSNRAATGPDIWVMNHDGTEQTQLTDHPGLDIAPAFSPDGRRIAFGTTRTGNGDIYVVDADGGNLTRVTDHPGEELYAAWSPDARKLVFTRSFDRNGGDLVVIDVDGSGERQLTDGPVGDGDPDWSPDGERIAFTSNRDLHFGVYTIPSEGGSVTRLSDPSQTHVDPSWSPDGTRIALRSTGVFDPTTIAVMTVATGELSEVVPDSELPADPAWSPDGMRIVYSAGLDLAVRELASGDRTALTDDRAVNEHPSWGSIPPDDSVAPLLSVPSTITVDATSPAGARVEFAVAATDDTDPTPSVACTPESGSTFPIGATTVACTATDDAGNRAEARFGVVVRGAAEQLDDLHARITGFGLQQGTERSLVAKIEAALSALESGDAGAACSTLAELVDQVRAQAGKKLTSAQAEEVLSAATRIRAVIGC